jgi:hypothetical protein
VVAFSFGWAPGKNATEGHSRLSHQIERTKRSKGDEMQLNQMVPLFLFLSVTSVAVFSFVSVAVWSGERRRERQAYYRSETIRKIAEMQAAGSSSAVDFLREEELNAVRRLKEGLKLGGLITSAIGIALMIFIAAVDHSRAYLAGLFPLFIGVAILSYTYLLAPRQP